jgi:ribulose-phosphate 3-epimerase
MKAGVAISPDTPSTSISDEVGELTDLLLVMTVYPGAGLFFFLFTSFSNTEGEQPPGRGGQKFMERCVPKVAELRARFPDKDIEVDGGINPKTIDVCAQAGMSYLCFGQ